MSRYTTDTAELKKLIVEHPEYPICILAGESANNQEYSWTLCSNIEFRFGEMLDCEQDINDCKIYTDRDDFEEDLEEWLWDRLCSDGDHTEEAFQKALAEEKAKYEPYWKNCIFIYADN